MAQPDDRLDYLASEEAYNGVGQSRDLEGWHLFKDTPTLKAFIKSNAILLALRGTADARDVRADASIAFNRLAKSDRYQVDRATVQAIAAQYSPSQYTYAICGHSLASAVAMQLQREFPFIKTGTFFNGALQPSDLWSPNNADREVYTSSDPLYQLMGRFWRGPKTVIPAANLSGHSNVISRAIDAVKSHGLQQFRALYGSGDGVADGPFAAGAIGGWVAHPLSDSDLRAILGPSISIMSYPQLRAIRHIEDALDPMGRLVYLFLTTSATSGHWQCCFVSGENELTFFDSYGMAPDEDFAWLSAAQRKQLHETRREVVRLLKDAEHRGFRVIINRHRFQSMKPDVATCGRWCALRCLLSFQTNADFAKMVDESGLAPDVFVAVVTHALINK